MSANLFVLVALQGSVLSFSPGYVTAAECLAVYRGPNVACFNYDPEGTTWTGFFKTPTGGFGSVYNFPNESLCQSYVGALRSDVPSACRQLARPVTCSAACVAPVQPSPIPPLPPEPKPDPASVSPEITPRAIPRVPPRNDIQRHPHFPCLHEPTLASFTPQPSAFASSSTKVTAPLNILPQEHVSSGRQKPQSRSG